MRRPRDTQSVIKVVLVVLASLAMNELAFLFLMPGEGISAAVYGGVSGVAGALLYLLLNRPGPEMRLSVSEPACARNNNTGWNTRTPAVAGLGGRK